MDVHGLRYDTGQAVRIEILGGLIARVEGCPEAAAEDWPWVAPGLVDLQVNGYGGREFSSPELTAEHVEAIGRTMESFGVVRYLPTVTTGPFEVLAHAMGTIAAACRASADVGRQVAGIHLEGPYLSPLDGPRGAHPKEHCRRPDWEEFLRLQAAAAGQIRLLTMAVEFDEAPEFIRRVTAAGVTVAIGHTAADSDEIRRAVDAGARLSTHLGNGCQATLRRHPNHLWDQLAEDRLTASLIVDGVHLPPEVVKTFVRAKTPSRCVLVSDLSGYAGLPPGRYPTGLCELEILDDGRLVIAGQRQLLAGASRPLGTGLARVMEYARVDLAEAIRMASIRPDALVGLPAVDLRPGDPADVVQFRLSPAAAAGGPDLHVQATISAGRVRHGNLWFPEQAG